MNDSRVDWVADLVKDARVCDDRVAQKLLIQDAIREWGYLAEEFPITDALMTVVSTRLIVALREVNLGDWRKALISLRLASAAITAVQRR